MSYVRRRKGGVQTDKVEAKVVLASHVVIHDRGRTG